MKQPSTAIGWCHWAREQCAEQDLPAREAHLLLVLASYVDPDGSGRATRRKLGAAVGCSARHASRLLAQLCERGLVQRTGARGCLRWRLNTARRPVTQLALGVDTQTSTPGGNGRVDTQRSSDPGHLDVHQSDVNPNRRQPPSPQPAAGGNGNRRGLRSNGTNPRALAAAAAQADRAAAEQARERGQPPPEQLVAALRARVDEDVYAIWLADLVVVARRGHVLTLDCPPQLRCFAEERFGRAIAAAADESGITVQWAPREARFTRGRRPARASRS